MEKSFRRLRVIKALGKSKLEFDNKIHRDGKGPLFRALL